MRENNFYKILRNKLYCGLIFIKAYKNEEAITVEANHEPLITKELFFDVQEILLGRGRKSKKYSKISPNTPLQGHLYCETCGENLTSSTSLNKVKKPYSYYHCQKGCCRVNSKSADQQIMALLKTIRVPKEILTLYLRIMKDISKDDNVELSNKITELNTSINKAQTRIQVVEDNFADGNLDLRLLIE